MIYIGKAAMCELDGEVEHFAVAADSYADAVAKVEKEAGGFWWIHLEEVNDGSVVWLPNEESFKSVKRENNF